MRGSPPNSFRNWARTVIAVSRRHGKSDEQIARWIKTYAKKRKIPRGTYQNIGPLFGIYSRGPYGLKLKSASRADMGNRIKNSPKIQLHMAELNKGIEQWQLSVLRTLRAAKNQGEDLSETKRQIIEGISKEWSDQPLSKIISAEDFIKRMFPELLQEEIT